MILGNEIEVRSVLAEGRQGTMKGVCREPSIHTHQSLQCFIGSLSPQVSAQISGMDTISLCDVRADSGKYTKPLDHVDSAKEQTNLE